MQAFLSFLTSSIGGPLGWLANLVLNFFWGKAAKAISTIEKDKANHESAINQAAQDTQAAKELKPESSAKEVDDAIDDELNHF